MVHLQHQRAIVGQRALQSASWRSSAPSRHGVERFGDVAQLQRHTAPTPEPRRDAFGIPAAMRPRRHVYALVSSAPRRVESSHRVDDKRAAPSIAELRQAKHRGNVRRTPSVVIPVVEPQQHAEKPDPAMRRQGERRRSSRAVHALAKSRKAVALGEGSEGSRDAAVHDPQALRSSPSVSPRGADQRRHVVDPRHAAASASRPRSAAVVHGEPAGPLAACRRFRALTIQTCDRRNGGEAVIRPLAENLQRAKVGAVGRRRRRRCRRSPSSIVDSFELNENPGLRRKKRCAPERSQRSGGIDIGCGGRRLR